MTREQVRAIVRERLTGWMRKLTDLHGTPAILVGVGHDHVGGQVQVLCVEDIDDTLLAAMLRHVLAEIAARGQGLALGATGNFPAGRDPGRPGADEGELVVACAADFQAGRVRMDFGKPVGWLSMLPEEAIQWGESLIAKARQLQSSTNQ